MKKFYFSEPNGETSVVFSDIQDSRFSAFLDIDVLIHSSNGVLTVNDDECVFLSVLAYARENATSDLLPVDDEDNLFFDDIVRAWGLN